MTAVSDVQNICLVQFSNSKNLIREIEKIKLKNDFEIILNENDILKLLKQELEIYFCGKLHNFTIPVHSIGTEFQKLVWNEATKTEYGDTKNYENISINLKKSKAFRAVANALSSNPVLLVIPCQRVINKNGKIGGYAGGTERKMWLLEHEKKYRDN